MEIYRLNKRNYYLYGDLVKKYPSLRKGCRTRADFIEKHKLAANHYTYARMAKDGSWHVSKGDSCRVDRFFLRVKHVDAHMITEEVEEKEVIMRPEVVSLDESDCFQDDDGNLMQIEVVGKRTVTEAYFKLKDVAREFQLPNLAKTVTRVKESSYVEGEHYHWFTYTADVTKKSDGSQNKRDLYLTYRGIIRVAFTTRKHVVESFVRWATETLFIAQMGTAKQKRQLASKLTGLDLAAIKEMNHATSGCISCVYLFSLGTVADLRDVMSIPDSYPGSSTVYKYGRTCDLVKRARDHSKTYGKMDGVSLSLVYHGYIDPERASEAETAIAHNMAATGLSFSYDTHCEGLGALQPSTQTLAGELIIASDRQMKHVREQYDMITELHRGRVKHIVDELEKQKKENELAKKETELAKKEIEILQLKLRLAELS